MNTGGLFAVYHSIKSAKIKKNLFLTTMEVLMLELVRWLIEIEGAASHVYAKAAKMFNGDKDYSEFLIKLSMDEAEHRETMCRAEIYLKDVDDYPAIITMDEERKWDIEAPFIEFRTKLNSGKLTKRELINYILIIEHSQLNQLFIYTLNAIKSRSGGVLDMSNDIDDHKKLIENFICTHPELDEFADRIKGLPKTSEERKKILIIDNTEENLTLLKDIFSNNFFVETAMNGEDALHKVGSTHYSAIITDIDMPVMNGITFYKKALDIVPGLSERIIFYTGQISKDRLTFFNENSLRYLIKPAPISKIRAYVSRMIR